MALQIKEKFGGLRFYIDGYSEEAWAVIEIAEGECSKLCELCGGPGEIRTDLGWIVTLCEEHYLEAEKKRDRKDG
jgi:hypothetical protein